MFLTAKAEEGNIALNRWNLRTHESKENSLKRLSLITSISRSSELNIIVFKSCSISSFAKNWKSMSLVRRRKRQSQVSFHCKNIQYLRIFLFIFDITPAKTFLHVSEKTSDQRTANETPSDIEKFSYQLLHEYLGKTWTFENQEYRFTIAKSRTLLVKKREKENTGNYKAFCVFSKREKEIGSIT